MFRVTLAALAALICSTADAQGPIRRALFGQSSGGFYAPAGPAVCKGPNCAACQESIASPPPFVAVPAQTPKPMADSKLSVGGRKLNLRPIRAKIIDGLVARGVDRAEATKVVGELGDGTLLKLILEHLPDILALIEKLLPLFSDGHP